MKDSPKMKSKSKTLGIYLPVYAAALVAAVVMRCVAMLRNLNYETGYFTDKALINASAYTAVAACIFFLTYIFAFGARRDIRFIPDFTSSATYVPTGLMTVSLIFVAAALIGKAADALDYIKYLKYLGSASALSQITNQRLIAALMSVTAVLAAFSAVYFALLAVIESRSSAKRAGLGMCAAVFFAVYSVYLYFSTELPLNSPNKATDQMAYLFAAVFFLYEARMSFAREKWRPYIAFGLIASMLAAYSSVPSLVVYFVKGETVSNSIYESVLTFSVFVFISARILVTPRLTEDKMPDTVSALSDFFDARAAEIASVNVQVDVTDITGGESLAEPEEAEEVTQLSIDDMEAAEKENEEA